MSEQTQSPYAGRATGKVSDEKIEYKSLSATSLTELDVLVSEALNDGYQPGGPQHGVVNNLGQTLFVQPVIKVPRSMMQPIRG
jgi:hypothetical protein